MKNEAAVILMMELRVSYIAINIRMVISVRGFIEILFAIFILFVGIGLDFLANNEKKGVKQERMRLK